MAVECTYCEEKVNAKRGIYIKCTTCQDIKLCLECFSAGATIAEHESDHPYELIDCGSFPIVDESWKAYEELALLEAIELYGIGSWTDIAKAVETRSAEECCERYLRVYVDNFFGRTAWNAIDRNLYTVQDHTCTHNQPLSPSLSLPEKHKIVDINREQQIRLGYMPKRDDFEREYDNEAELLVSKLAVNANDDTDLDQDLKIAHINMYTDKLRERFRRKRVVLEYNLVKLFFHMHPEENGNHSETQTKPPDNLPQSTQSMILDTADPANVTPSSRLLSTTDTIDKPTELKASNQHNSSTANEKTNPSVQNTILNYFRRVEPATNGTTKKSTAPPENSILSSYFSDLNKTMAEQDFNTMEKKLRIFCQFSSADEHNQLIRNLAREKELKVKIKELIKKRKNGFKFHSLTSNSVNGNDSDVSRKQSPSTNKKSPIKSHLSNRLEEPMDIDTDDTNTLSPTKVTQKRNNNKNESNKAIMNLHFNQNWNSEPCWRLLSESEKRLCKTSNLKPSRYVSFKAFLIRVSLE